LREALATDHIVLVAGFQGVSTQRDVTTLGRGGSDTTAVALAAVLEADVCEIYTDVTGVFTADPRIVPGARKLPLVSHEEMLEAAASGSKVLALRSVEFARNHNVPVHVRSSFVPDEGTWITEETPGMEKAIVSAIAHKSDEAKITLAGVADSPGVAAAIFTALADAMINVDTIIQNVSHHGHTDVSLTVPLIELRKAEQVLRGLSGSLEFNDLMTDDQIGKVTLIGAGMKSEPGVAAKMFRVLAAEQINIQMIDTSTIRITVVVDRREVERAVRALHDAFDLGGEAQRRANV
jgi:aspartate kinase